MIKQKISKFIAHPYTPGKNNIFVSDDNKYVYKTHSNNKKIIHEHNVHKQIDSLHLPTILPYIGSIVIHGVRFIITEMQTKTYEFHKLHKKEQYTIINILFATLKQLYDRFKFVHNDLVSLKNVFIRKYTSPVECIIGDIDPLCVSYKTRL